MKKKRTTTVLHVEIVSRYMSYQTVWSAKHYRQKPGRCTNCRTIRPDDINWKNSCLEEEDYEEVMEPIRKKIHEDQEKNSKLYKFYDVCPLCKGFYHTAKACMLRKHTLYFKEAKDQIQQLTSRMADSQQASGLLFPNTNFIHPKPEEDTDEESDEEGHPIHHHH